MYSIQKEIMLLKQKSSASCKVVFFTEQSIIYTDVLEPHHITQTYMKVPRILRHFQLKICTFPLQR